MTPPPLAFFYTNHKGARSHRLVVPKRIRFGSTEWHPQPQWLIDAFDIHKNAMRTFAFKDIA
jgi:predicted DNA-binding transcriptional regulator YafY